MTVAKLDLVLDSLQGLIAGGRSKDALGRAVAQAVVKIQGAVVKEQGVTFAVVIVKPSVLQVRSQVEDMQASMHGIFGPMPIVLMAQDGRGRPTYMGRPDIVKFLANIDFRRIPWKEYTVG